MSEFEKEKVELSEEGKVIIKREAFKNILTHVLEYGNIYLDYSTQSMGFCIGNINAETQTIEVVNAIPITHGDNIEIGFSEKDHAALLNIQKLHPGKVIGWYHSHPGFDIFFSKADKANNLYFQTELNPLGFGIVIDPSKINKDKNFGLEVYRLKDFKLGIHSDSVRVRYEIEFPNSLEYFTWIQKFVEDSQMKSPILTREQSEIQEHSSFELQEIPVPKEEVIEEPKFAKSKIDPIISGLKEGTEMFTDSIMDTYKTELTAWEQQFNQGTIQSTKMIQDSLKQMGSTISDGLEKVESYIDKIFKKRINEFNNEVYSLVNQRVKKQENMKNDVTQIKETLIDDATNRVNGIITQIYYDLTKGLETLSSQANEIQEVNFDIEQKITKSNEVVSKIATAIKEELAKISTGITTITNQFESNQLDAYDKLINEIEPLQANHSEIRDLIDKFQKIISDFRTIKK